MPSFTSGCPSFAVLLAIRIVQESASSQPPPSANPLIAQIDGFPIVSSRWKTLWPKSENSLPLTGVCNASSLISAPATNAFSPAPVLIIARIEKRMLQLFHRLAVQRIQHLRPVEGDVRNPVFPLVQYVLVTHLFPLLGSAFLGVTCVSALSFSFRH